VRKYKYFVLQKTIGDSMFELFDIKIGRILPCDGVPGGDDGTL